MRKLTSIFTVLLILLFASQVYAGPLIFNNLASPGAIGAENPAAGTFSPVKAKGPAIITSFAGTVTAAASTTVTFSSAADAILAGYSATNPMLGTALISNALTRYIVSWTNATTCVVDNAVTWAGTAITSTQLPIATFVDSSGVVKGWMAANATIRFMGSLNGPTSTNILSIAGSVGITDGYGFTFGTSANQIYGGPSYGIVLISGNIAHTLTTSGNILLGGLAAAGTSAAKVLAMGSGTAPTTSPADAAQMWVADIGAVAGKAGLHMRDEAGDTGPVAFAGVKVVSHSATENVTVDQMYDQAHIVTGAYVLSLPTAAVGYRAKFKASTAAVFSLDLITGTDVIQLNGIALAAGNKATSDGAENTTFKVECNEAGIYEVNNSLGIGVDGGA